MEQIDVKNLIACQKEFFDCGNTLNINVRIAHLKALKNAIIKYQNQIYEALYKDLGKSKDEAYMCEVGLVLADITYQLKHIKKFTKPKRVKTPLFQFVAKSYKIASPYGNVLIMSPWNYPFLLSFEPLVEAIASGNTVVLKPSRYSFNTSNIMKTIINEVFDKKYCEVILGGQKENTLLINEKWDYVFFTGSKTIGNLVYEAQSKYLTPVTLELGGKSPVIIDSKVNLKIAAKRIAWGKTINCGQTCVAPDHIYIPRSLHKEFIELLKQELTKLKPNALTNDSYCKMINNKHFERAIKLIDEKKVVYGGKYDENTLKIEPTIIDDASYNDLCMQEEIFAPILPVLIYDDLTEVVKQIKAHDHPLAFYIFSKNRKNINYLLHNIGFGGGCVNDVVMHLATSELGFGGYKESGMGQYHGKIGFDLFSHYKSIIDKATYIDMPMRYKPENKLYNKIIKIFLK